MADIFALPITEPFKSWVESAHPEQLKSVFKKLEDMNLSALQRRVVRLPQELQDDILEWLIRMYLVPGKVFLDAGGRFTNKEKRSRSALSTQRAQRAQREDSFHKNEDEAFRDPDFSIFQALSSRRWAGIACEIFYGGNTFDLPREIMIARLFPRRLGPERIAMVKSVELRMFSCLKDFYLPTQHPNTMQRGLGPHHLWMWKLDLLKDFLLDELIIDYVYDPNIIGECDEWLNVVFNAPGPPDLPVMPRFPLRLEVRASKEVDIMKLKRSFNVFRLREPQPTEGTTSL